MIRLLASVDSPVPPGLFCQIWFEDEMVTSDITYIESLQMYEDEVLPSFMMACPLPELVIHRIPQSVSLVEHPCDQPRQGSNFKNENI